MSRLSAECPGLAVLLGRYFDAATAELLAQDYCSAADRGGNRDVLVVRDEGVSFNPRIARIVTLLLRDGGVTDSWVIRVAIYRAGAPEDGLLEGVDPLIVSDVERLSRDPRAGPDWYTTVALAYVLDRVRHLHMTSMTAAEREKCLENFERLPIVADEFGSEPLLVKVRHAISLQRKRLSVESQNL